MKQTYSSSLQVYPLGGRLPRKVPIKLDLTKGDLIKQEAVTLIWSNIPVEGIQAVVKMYRRGFWLGCWNRITFFRSKIEFIGLSELKRLGIPCSIPLFWCHGRLGPFGWGEMLVTEWVCRNQPLRHLLAARPEAGMSLDLSPLFSDLAMMHAAGLHHGMLRTRNILVKDYPDSPSFVFIDLPRSHRFKRDIRGTRMALYDLLSLCEGLIPYFSDYSVESWLSAYGVPKTERKALAIRLKRYRSTAFLRKISATEFDVRKAGTWFFSFPLFKASQEQTCGLAEPQRTRAEP